MPSWSISPIFNNKYRQTQNVMRSENQQSVESIRKQSSPKKDFLQQHFTQVIEKHPTFTPEKAFQLEYCKLYIEHINLCEQIKNVKSEVAASKRLLEKCRKTKIPGSAQKINALSNSIHLQVSSNTENADKKRRIRRNANQIVRHYICPEQRCGKSYGSQGSLNQHLKLKHGIDNLTQQNHYSYQSP